MEDKKIVKLEDEQTEQIAGGSVDGITNYTECRQYQLLCGLKEEYDEKTFRMLVAASAKLCRTQQKSYCLYCEVHDWLA